ncbi:MAG: hypothetical protein LN408_03285 [Candidatus Thermoplasmatota archaeon]|nr:hypothetical protein [Candidatus Thermoplasmatota archaeon]
MNILLIDHDSLIPNLALMKISSYHKSKGDNVFLNSYSNPDKVYISCIFKKNKEQLNGIKLFFDCEVIMGGVGVNNIHLPEKIENRKPDYKLYDLDYSMGYTSKGCIRKCSFCIVPQYEGKIKNHHTIDHIMNEYHNKLILLDNNILASPNWKENLKIIKDRDIIVNFCQGLDIRLINNMNTKYLSDLKIRNRKFNGNQIHFAFDSLDYKNKVINGINIMSDHGIKPYRLMFYILVNYDTSLYEDLYRFGLIKKLGSDGFIMKYSDSNNIINKFARYVNMRVHKSVKFENYKYLTLIESMKIKNIMEKLPKEYRF